MDETTWNMNHDDLRQIFCAAISGICANPSFFGSIFQQSPTAAVEFANEVVLASLKSSGGRIALEVPYGSSLHARHPDPKPAETMPGVERP